MCEPGFLKEYNIINITKLPYIINRRFDVFTIVTGCSVTYSLKEIFIFVTIQIGEYILNNDIQKNM